MSNKADSVLQPRPERRWQAAVAAAASTLFALPLIVKGTPDVESYMLAIFSTVAFVQDLVRGGDPWFAAAYGFGVPLPTSTWLIQFPPALPAALAGIDWLYGAIWFGGEFVFAFYFLRLAMALTGRRGVALVLLTTAMLSFSNLGTTYVDDWPEAFLGWAFWPACLWYIGQTLVEDSRLGRLKAGAACAFVLGLFTGSTHHNEMVTFFSGLAVMLVFLLPLRPKNVIAVAAAVVVALISSSDVLVPAVRGMVAGGANPLNGPLPPTNDATTIGSYVSFLEPLWTMSAGGAAAADGESFYARVPFYGLAALVLSMIGVSIPFRSRAPVGVVPNDLARALAVGFLVYTALTVLPSWVVLNMPRMWTYRDGQTVLGLLCAGMALEALRPRLGRLVPVLVVVHIVQMMLVAEPIVASVLRDDDSRLFGYARGERVLFDQLREAGVGRHSRLILAGELEELMRGSLAESGVTALTDFALEDIPVVNAWYRGAQTPDLGAASQDGRYGAYETIISWKDLQYLDAAGLNVLGITDVAVLETDLPQLRFRDSLRTAATIELPGGRRMHVLRNDSAWTRAVLLSPGPLEPLLARPDCPSPTIYCRDFAPVAARLQAHLPVAWNDSSIRATLPPAHNGGTVLVSVTAGLLPRARVDGTSRPVSPLADTFAAFDVRPGERTFALSVRWTPRIVLTLMGIGTLLGSLAVAVVPAHVLGAAWRRIARGRARRGAPPPLDAAGA